MVQHAFPEKIDFEATDVIVATWEKVGYYDSKADQLNTFQVCVNNVGLSKLITSSIF